MFNIEFNLFHLTYLSISINISNWLLLNYKIYKITIVPLEQFKMQIFYTCSEYYLKIYYIIMYTYLI